MPVSPDHENFGGENRKWILFVCHGSLLAATGRACEEDYNGVRRITGQEIRPAAEHK